MSERLEDRLGSEREEPAAPPVISHALIGAGEWIPSALSITILREISSDCDPSRPPPVRTGL